MKVQTNNFSISGKVLEVRPTMQFDKFAKRILVMEVMNGKYVNKIEFEFINESMQQIDSIQRNDWVTVLFALKSRSSIKDGQERIYHSLDGISCYKE
jgi:nicotinamide mononucleotide adenylyltransferase